MASAQETIIIDDDEKAAAKKPLAKRSSNIVDKDSEHADGGSAASPKAKKPRAKKVQETSVDALGWTIVPPSLIYRDLSSKTSDKIAGFDVDGTLMNTKSGSTFSKGPDDWKFFNKKVPEVLKGLQEDGYKIVIFSNQGGIKTALTGKAAETAKGKIEGMLKQAGVSALVMLATGKDEFRKPSTGMWDLMSSELNGGVEIDKSKSFYCGDAAGRENDWVNPETRAPADGDKMFAANVGIGFKTPEDLFGVIDGKKLAPALAGGKGSAPTAEAIASSPNAEIIGIFKELADYFFKSGEEKHKFKAIAFRKVVTALTAFAPKISSSNLKEVNAIAGVGKGSMAVIKEWVETGKVQELEAIRAGSGGGGSEAAASAGGGGAATAVANAGPKNAAAAVAMKFM